MTTTTKREIVLPPLPTGYPFDSRSWDLYRSKPGVEVAIAGIDAAVLTVARAMVDAYQTGHDIGPRLINALVKEHVRPVLVKHGDFGARDGEPASAIAAYLGKVAGVLGVDAFSWRFMRHDVDL